MSGIQGTCCSDCPGVTEVQVGIGALVAATTLAIAGRLYIQLFNLNIKDKYSRLYYY